MADLAFCLFEVDCLWSGNITSVPLHSLPLKFLPLYFFLLFEVPNPLHLQYFLKIWGGREQINKYSKVGFIKALRSSKAYLNHSQSKPCFQVFISCSLPFINGTPVFQSAMQKQMCLPKSHIILISYSV